MQKWEYLYVVVMRGTVVRINKETFPIPNILNEGPKDASIFEFLDEFGRTGWELITHVTSPLVEGEPATIHLILKRPLE